MDDALNHSGSIRIRNLEVRLAKTRSEILAAQALRYQVFYREMAATPSADMTAEGRDFDRFDDVADHLLVIDHDRPDGESVVGTYRLMRRAAAERLGGFYTADEFDISQLLAHDGEILELGRSCVHAKYRTRPTMQLLWRGIADYVARHDIEIMFGCASLPGTDPERLAGVLSYLYHYHLAPPAFRPSALLHRHVDMRMVAATELDPRRVAASLPPLIKGYLRLGGFVGEGAVVDHDFNTTDVCIVVKTDLITEKYARHYGNRVGGGHSVFTPSLDSQNLGPAIA